MGNLMFFQFLLALFFWFILEFISLWSDVLSTAFHLPQANGKAKQVCILGFLLYKRKPILIRRLQKTVPQNILQFTSQVSTILSCTRDQLLFLYSSHFGSIPGRGWRGSSWSQEGWPRWENWGSLLQSYWFFPLIWNDVCNPTSVQSHLLTILWCF